MAVMVMAFGIATSITTMNYGFRALDTARNTTIASQILQSVMEDTRLLPWSSGSGNSISSLQAAQGSNGSTVTLDSSFTAGDSAAQAMVNRFTVTRKITDVSGIANMKRIDLTATWKGIDGRSHSVSYSSYYGQYGLHDYFVH